MTIHTLALLGATASGWAVLLASMVVLCSMKPVHGRWATALGWISTGAAGAWLGLAASDFITPGNIPVAMFPITLAMIAWGHLDALIEHATQPTKHRVRAPIAVAAAVMLAGCVLSLPVSAQTPLGKTTLHVGAGTGKALSEHPTPAECKAAAKTAGKWMCKEAFEVAVPPPVVEPPPPVATWAKCADERTRCAFTGRREVRYGDGAAAWVVRVHEGGVECTNDVFTDPAVGNLKRCEVSSLTTTKPISPPVNPPPVVVPPPVEPPADPGPIPTPGTRDAFKQPFASNSIWNVAIGSGAVYVPAALTSVFGDQWASMPYPDEDVIVLKPTAPLTAVRESTWAGDRCQVIGSRTFATVPIPSGYTNPSSNHNMAAGILMPNGRTIVNVQPLTRCAQGGVATSIVRWPDSDLYGDGIDGAHGGSGMSSIGGALRVGELRPGQQGPAHAIKLIVYMREAFRCTTSAQCFRWPAKTHDGYAIGHYGSAKAGPAAMKMGALLALPASLNVASLGLKTEAGKQLAWTLQNYGGYVVDDSYGGQFGIATETGPDGSFVQQFAADYGFSFHARQNATGKQAEWVSDMQTLVRNLHVVDNNSPTAIGGGGTPRQPAKPAIAP